MGIYMYAGICAFCHIRARYPQQTTRTTVLNLSTMCTMIIELKVINASWALNLILLVLYN